MAKKHSSKTATEKAWSASEPRLQVFSGWQGVNFAQAPLDWEPNEPIGPHNQRQNDLKPNFFHVQNNAITVDNLTIETRMDSEIIGKCPTADSQGNPVEYEFTGVACMYHRWLFCVIREHKEAQDTFVDRIVWRSINGELNDGTINSEVDPDNGNWNLLPLNDIDVGVDPAGYEICEIGYFEKRFLATTLHDNDNPNESQYTGEFFTATLEYKKVVVTNSQGIIVESDTLELGELKSVKYVPNPSVAYKDTVQEPYKSAPVLNPIGMNVVSPENSEALVEFSYAWVNEFGSTIASSTSSVNVDVAPQSWNALKYMKISKAFPTKDIDDTDFPAGSSFVKKYGIKGVDVYFTVEGYQTKSFAIHVDVAPTDTKWSANFLGGLQDISQWSNVILEEPKENTSKGVRASHFSNHDSRLYFWGDPENPYRLYIGGIPGKELSVARGHGGAFVDIEPGTGLEVKGTAKWKTSSGANIITIMCGNPNTNMIKRFNLVETNLTVTNEISSKGYMYEEVSNVVGCNSRWGYGVYADGLYAINRYGLMLTTMAMEYNNQMRIQSISDVIKPIFSERLGHRLDDARMVCIDNVIYIVLSEEHNPGEPTVLDQVVLCYDLGLKAWYTITSDEIFPDTKHSGSGEVILHALPIDSQEHAEGLGLITNKTVILYPNTGIQDIVAPNFNVLVETGELMGKQPKQMTMYLCQLELRFDYFIGNAKVIVEGIDYYGRPVTVVKELNSRINPGTNYNGDTINPDDDGVTRNRNLMRDYTEWIRVDKLMESYRIRIIGKARFRLNSINAKVYVQDDKIGLPYGFDSHVYYQNRYGNEHLGYTNDDNHWLMDYNNLRRTLLT